MNTLSIILIILILGSGIAIIYILYYNKLMFYKTRIEKAENIIDESLRKKYDLLCEINIEIKKVVSKKDYLKDYIDLKNQRITNYDMDRKLIEAFNLVKELVSDHKKLNNKNVNNVLESVIINDEELSSGKSFYNKNTTELNSIIRKFPSNVIAKIHHFRIKPYFDQKNMQDAVLDDFKL